MQMGKALGIQEVSIQSDSQLVVGQLEKGYESKGDKVRQYKELASALKQNFRKITVV